MTQQYTKPDSVQINKIVLSSISGKKDPIDIAQYVVSFDIYEDMMFPCMRADIVIIDSVDIITSYPIIGEEYIEISFQNPGTDTTFEHKFQVVRQSGQMFNQTGTSRTYVIQLISPEFITNSSKYISEKHTGTIDNIVGSVIKNHLNTKKTYTSEPTKGAQNNLVTRLRPFQAIDYHRKRAVSQQYASSSYCFFENQKGFNLLSMEYCLDKNKNNTKVFLYDKTQLTDAKKNNYRSIIDMHQMSLVDNTKKHTQSGLNGIVRRFDLLTGKVQTTTYNNSQQQNKFKYSSNKPIPLNTSSYEQKYGNTAATSLLVPHSSEYPENYIDTTMGAKHAFVTKMGQNIYQLYINGDTTITVGDVITVNVPNTTGDTSPTTQNRLYAGNYLVKTLRHIVMNKAISGQSYTMSMELVKGYYEDHA
jgi:hypothetical protein